MNKNGNQLFIRSESWKSYAPLHLLWQAKSELRGAWLGLVADELAAEDFCEG